MTDRTPWIEWLCHSNFSFLLGASHPEEYVQQALHYHYHALAIADFNGLYGIVRAYRQRQSLCEQGLMQAGTLPLFYGSEINLDCDHEQPVILQESLAVLALNKAGYRELCQLIKQAHQERKSHAYLDLATILAKPSRNLIYLQPMRGLIRKAAFKEVRAYYAKLRDALGENFYLVISRHLNPSEDYWIQPSLILAKELGIPTLFSQDCFFHHPDRKPLSDLLHAIRLNQKLTASVAHMFVNQERCLQDQDKLVKRYQAIPHYQRTLINGLELSERFDFCLSQLRYQYPQEMIPAGYTAYTYLEYLVWSQTYSVYPSPPDQLIQTIKRELDLVEVLEFADYFLTVWDIVRWARQQGILCQGRGSAANSAICYILGITAVDPTQFDLLFERFISLERGDPPDIDVDFEHERREQVIQYIYQRYGRQRAAMVANVITFRSRGAIRAVGKALGVSDELISQASKLQELRSYRQASTEQNITAIEQPLQEAEGEEDIPNSKIWQLWSRLSEQLKGFPRHMGIHSGGFIISQQPLNELCPQEPATMPGRTVIQWSKDDVEALGLFKIDILALGMLSALRKSLQLIKTHYHKDLRLQSIPANDPATYHMIQAAKTVGTFQIESRAQMSMLPRLRPKTLYDLVIQVGIIRPGPIQGGLIHPYLRRRHGLEEVIYAHPRLKPILQRTLGVPIFQEQIMRVAMAVGDFSPGEADQLRKQIGAWKLNKDLGGMVEKLRRGMQNNRIAPHFIDQIISHLQGFADYGFPESHAVSFALLAYASSYIKCHFPAVFYTSLLNSQPMGFYSRHALIHAAQREGVEVHAVCIQRSNWDTCLETDKQGSSYAMRLGLHMVRSLSKQGAAKLLERREQRQTFWSSLSDFLQDVSLHRIDLIALTAANALSCFGIERRAALWITEAVPLPYLLDNEQSYDFTTEDALEAAEQDFASTGTTLGDHPSSFIKTKYWSYPISSKTLKDSKSLAQCHNHQIIRSFGMVLVRQSPATAKGMLFLTLEDEHGFLNLAFYPKVAAAYNHLINRHGFLCFEGKLQKQEYGEGHSILVRKVFEPILDEENIIQIRARIADPSSQAKAAAAEKTLAKARNYM